MKISEDRLGILLTTYKILRDKKLLSFSQIEGFKGY